MSSHRGEAARLVQHYLSLPSGPESRRAPIDVEASCKALIWKISLPTLQSRGLVVNLWLILYI
jgi:hypothetical protein